MMPNDSLGAIDGLEWPSVKRELVGWNLPALGYTIHKPRFVNHEVTRSRLDEYRHDD